MPIPTPSTLERLLAPYAGARGLAVRVWGVDLGAVGPEHTSADTGMFPTAAPRFLCLGASPEGLVLVRQTRATLEDLDGQRVPWDRVHRCERDSHLVHDELIVEIEGRPPSRVSVSNHLLLPHNRHSAKELADLAARCRVLPAEPAEHPHEAVV